MRFVGLDMSMYCINQGFNPRRCCDLTGLETIIAIIGALRHCGLARSTRITSFKGTLVLIAYILTHLPLNINTLSNPRNAPASDITTLVAAEKNYASRGCQGMSKHWIAAATVSLIRNNELKESNSW